MTQPTEERLLKTIASSQCLNWRTLRLTAISGGFSSINKFIISQVIGTLTKPIFFAKVADKQLWQDGALEISAEIQAYKILSRLGLSGVYFPRFIDCIESDNLVVLLIEYLSDVTWNIKWGISDIEKLHNAIQDIHNTVLSPQDINDLQNFSKIYKNKSNLRSRTYHEAEKTKQLFFQAWDDKGGSFVNSKGEIYYRSSIDLFNELKTRAAQASFLEPQKLILRDLNAGNISVGTTKIVFVDPLYLDLGNPDLDLVMLGVTIIRSLKNEKEATFVRNYVIHNFITSKPILAFLIKYWIASAALAVDPRDEPWRSFQQEYASTALEIWNEIS